MFSEYISLNFILFNYFIYSLFIFQACRGNQIDNGVVLSPRSLTPSEETDTVTSYKIPTHADFLIAHSSVQGKSIIYSISILTFYFFARCTEIATAIFCDNISPN